MQERERKEGSGVLVIHNHRNEHRVPESSGSFSLRRPFRPLCSADHAAHSTCCSSCLPNASRRRTRWHSTPSRCRKGCRPTTERRSHRHRTSRREEEQNLRAACHSALAPLSLSPPTAGRNACCTGAELPTHIKAALRNVHPEVVSRYYGGRLESQHATLLQPPPSPHLGTSRAPAH